jgi:hypothetical protein
VVDMGNDGKVADVSEIGHWNTIGSCMNVGKIGT